MDKRLDSTHLCWALGFSYKYRITLLQFWKPVGYKRLITFLDSVPLLTDCYPGLISSQKRPLTEYCESISSEFIRRKRDALLLETRSICLSRDYDYSIMEEHVMRDGMHLNHFYNNDDPLKWPEYETASEIDGLFVFPKCAISHKVAKINELLETTLNDMLEMDNSWYQ